MIGHGCKYGHIPVILAICYLLIINISKFLKEKNSKTTVNDKYSNYESIEQRMTRLNYFCDLVPPFSGIGHPAARNQFITFYLNKTGDVFCLNPKTGSTSLTILLYLMSVGNVSALSLKSLSSGLVGFILD